LGAKRRIYQVAKEFDISNDALIQFLEKLGHDVRNHMSPVSPEMYDEARKKFISAETEKDAELDFRRRLKQKHADAAARQAEAQKRLEERLKAATEFMTDRSSIRMKEESLSDEHESIDSYFEDTKKLTQTPEETGAADKSIRVPGSSKIKKSREEDTSPEKTNALSADASLRSRDGVEVAKLPGDKKIKIIETPEKTTGMEETPAKTHSVTSEVQPVRPEIENREMGDQTIEMIDDHSRQRMKTEKTLDKSAKKPHRDVVEPGTPASDTALTVKPGEESDDSETKKKKRKRRRKKKTEIQIEPIEEISVSELEGALDKADPDRKRRKKAAKKGWEGEDEARDKKDKSKDRFKKKKKKKKPQISEAEVEESIKQTLAIIEDATKGRKKRKRVRDKDAEEIDEDTNLLRVNDFSTVGEFANSMGVETNELIRKCIEMGMLVSINQRLDKDVMEMLADEFGFKIEILPEYGHDLVEELEDEEEEDTVLESRAPVVTIMGHVDHGKTSLLDYLRESNIIGGEAGGITQHIGAYEVMVNGKKITFLDTPGHEAFTAMRARGVQITDIVILIVAADDAVMPQTIEAINHAQAANVPIIVAINKIDRPNANAEMIKKQLADHNVLIEEWGGRYQCAEISAKTGEGIPRLLDSILIEADIKELKANFNRLARGVILESRLDKGKGVVASVLVQKGTLKIGQPFIVGQYFGKVRSLYNERNQRVKDVFPSQPVQVVGFSGLPGAGDAFVVLKSEKDTREISLKRQQIRREQDLRQTKHLTLDEISRRIKQGHVKELIMIVKADVDGSVEALSDSLTKVSNEEVAVKVIHKGVGAISESDVLLASASNAVIIGFQVRPTTGAREIAKREMVEIRQYSVIYDAIAEVKSALEGMLEPETTEEVSGTVEVRQIFKVPKVGVIAGCHVVSGRVTRNDLAKLYRDDKLIFEGKIGSLRRFKEDTKEVSAGFECGVGIDGFNDIHVNDIIEPYRIIKVKRTLTSVKTV